MNKENKDFKDFDYVKLNSLLAYPEFANWYYNRVSNDLNNVSIDEFVNLLYDYSNTYNKFQ